MSTHVPSVVNKQQGCTVHCTPTLPPQALLKYTTCITTLTVPWSELRHRQKELQLQLYGLGIAADKNNCWIPPRTEFSDKHVVVWREDGKLLPPQQLTQFYYLRSAGKKKWNTHLHSHFPRSSSMRFSICPHTPSNLRSFSTVGTVEGKVYFLWLLNCAAYYIGNKLCETHRWPWRFPKKQLSSALFL